MKDLRLSDNLMVMTLETADLLAVVALADELHFGRAAERLHVSQPALSKQIQRVEAKVGGPLFVRGYRDVQVDRGRTTAGGQRASPAAELAKRSRPRPSRRARRRGAAQGRLRHRDDLFDLLPDVLLRFRRAHPGVEVRLQDMSTPSQLAALVSGDIDVGFVRLPVTQSEYRGPGGAPAIGSWRRCRPRRGGTPPPVFAPWPATPSSCARGRRRPATTTTS